MTPVGQLTLTLSPYTRLEEFTDITTIQVRLGAEQHAADTMEPASDEGQILIDLFLNLSE